VYTKYKKNGFGTGDPHLTIGFCVTSNDYHRLAYNFAKMLGELYLFLKIFKTLTIFLQNTTILSKLKGGGGGAIFCLVFIRFSG